MEKLFYYFGFGANKSPEMINAIIGRKPEGFPVFPDDYELCVEKWDELNETAREHLSGSWDKSFSSYTIRERIGSRVYGTCWKVTKKERELIKDWELCGIWSRSVKVVVSDSDGNLFPTETEVVENYRIKQVVFEKNYRVYVAPRARMLAVARKSRKDFLLNA